METNPEIVAQQQPQQPVGTPSVQIPNRKSSRFPLVLGIAALLLLVGGGAYYLGTKTAKPTQQQTLYTQPTATSVPTQAPTSSPSGAMNTDKTYTNTTYGFQLHYPASWNYNSMTNYPNIIFFSPNPITFHEASEGPITPISVIIKTNTTTQQEVDTYKNSYQYQNFRDETITVGGVQARKISGTVGATSLITGKFNVELFVPKGNQLFILTYIQTDGVDVSVFNQMLETFKFTN